MPIELLDTPETIQDTFGRDLTLTHVFHGIHIEPNEVFAYSVRGVLVNGNFGPVESTRKHERIIGENYERLLASNPAGNDFRVSDARTLRREIEGRKAKQAQRDAELIERQRVRNQETLDARHER